jgi:hypothetical protein
MDNISEEEIYMRNAIEMKALATMARPAEVWPLPLRVVVAPEIEHLVVSDEQRSKAIQLAEQRTLTRRVPYAYD